MAQRSIATRVLIVDDDDMSRELLCVLLEVEGYTVESAGSGKDALALLRDPAFIPDLVLADVQMPGATAAQFARKLRRACAPATILLAISGSQPPAQALSLFDGFLLKPFKMRQVTAVLPARSRPPNHPDHPQATEGLLKRKKGNISQLVRPETPPIRLGSISASSQEAASKLRMNVQLQEPQQAQCVDTESTASAPLLNKAIYRQLAGSIPRPQLQEMYALCVNDARRRIALMRTLAANRDSAQFVREAHAIKGGCGMLGATQLHRMAAELEESGLEAGHSGVAGDIDSLDELSAACDRLERMLRSRA